VRVVGVAAIAGAVFVVRGVGDRPIIALADDPPRRVFEAHAARISDGDLGEEEVRQHGAMVMRVASARYDPLDSGSRFARPE
jgi:hypothetical protein